MKTLRLLIILIALLLQSCNGQTKKINGLSFVAHSDPIDERHTEPVIKVNANFAAIMPFGFIRDLKHPEIIFNTNKQWFGETRVGAKQYIDELRKKGIKIMLKPQIWVWKGEYTGYIEMVNETDWNVLEASYTKFILEFAELAQEMDTELLCIGTELEKFVENRPEYWLDLIQQIRKKYKGKLTYAANWDEYKRTPFWNELDYIGVDAYFPVSDEKTPSLSACKKGWQKHKELIKSKSMLHDKPVLFTEFGYRSVDFSGKEPWKSDRSMNVTNLDAQVNTTQALFEEFWKEDWFAGGFIWKWFHNYENSGGENNSQFTPQNKPVEDTIKLYYSNQ
ncbi:glycoside hydrolase [Flavobacteriales bacterium 34_180_T64]|nr:glycoside hydrolase [Flavobacteriales bacterium 34_180_T64]